MFHFANMKVKKSLPLIVIISLALLFSGCSGSIGSRKYIKNGIQYTDNKEWEKGVDYLKEAVKKYPENVELKIMLFRAEWEASLSFMAKGEGFLREEKFNEAISEFKMSLLYNTSNFRAKELLDKAEKLKKSNTFQEEGRRLMEEGKYLPARDCFEKAIALNPDNKTAQEFLSYFIPEEKKGKNTEPPVYDLKLRSDAPVSLKFKNTPIVNVFEILSKLSGINFIFDKDMKESKVTLFMTDVPFDRFIDVLLRTNDLSARLINDKTMLVYPNTPSKTKEYTDLQIKTFYLSNIDSPKMLSILSKILKINDLSSNDKLNSIVIRGTPETIALASRIIEANDREPAEVILNVEILEVNRSKEHQLGLQFSDSLTLGIGDTSTEIGEVDQFSSYASLYSLDGLSNKELLVSLPTATLNILKTDGDTKTLAKPQIRVKNMEKASIHVGDRIPIRSNRKVDSSNNVTYDYEYQDVGIKLDVLPVINMENEISLTVSLEVSGLGVSVGTADDPQYTILTRTAKTVLTMKDGEMIVIGGLIKDEDIESIRKLPVLGDLPLLGALFSNYGSQIGQKDVVMIITPGIIKSQIIPEGDMLTMWSGKERDLSVKPPYEHFREAQKKYSDHPSKAYFDMKETQKKGEAPPQAVIKKAIPPEVIAEDKKIREKPVKAHPPKPLTGSLPEPKNAPVVDQKEQPENASISVIETKTPATIKEKKSEKKDESAYEWPVEMPFSIHVNSYKDKKNAMQRVASLTGMQYHSFFLSANIPEKGLYYRVFVGQFENLSLAKEQLKKYQTKKEFREDIHIMTRQDAMGG